MTEQTAHILGMERFIEWPISWGYVKAQPFWSKLTGEDIIEEYKHLIPEWKEDPSLPD